MRYDFKSKIVQNKAQNEASLFALHLCTRVTNREHVGDLRRVVTKATKWVDWSEVYLCLLESNYACT